MRELFTIDNISYKFLAKDYSISFSMRRGASKQGIYPLHNNRYGLYDDEYEFDDLNLCLSPFKVFEKVVELSLKWIREEQPYTFSFSTDSKRKARVYDYLVNKTLKNNPDINKKYFSHKGNNGHTIFYRKYTSPMAA